MKEELKYQIGITLIEGVGDVVAKKLIAYCGSVEAVFKEKKAKTLQEFKKANLIKARQ